MEQNNRRTSSIEVLVNVWAGDTAERFRQSLSSILSQTVRPIRVIVIVDGVVHESIERVLTEFQAKFSETTVVRLKENLGLAAGRNAGLKEAASDYVALHDADDLMHPHRIEVLENSIAVSQPDVICSSAVEFDDRTRLIVGQRTAPSNLDRRPSSWLLNNPIAHSTVLIRRASCSAVGGYRSVRFLEDYDLWLRILENGGRYMTISQPLQALRVDPEHSSRRGGIGFWKSEVEVAKAIRRIFRIGYFMSLNRLLARMVVRLLPRQIRSRVLRFSSVQDCCFTGFKVEDYLASDMLR